MRLGREKEGAQTVQAALVKDPNLTGTEIGW